MKIKELKETVNLDGATASFADKILSVKGPTGEIKRKFNETGMEIKIDDNKIFVQSKKINKHQKIKVCTAAAHIKNMVRGAKQKFVYKLKICSGHFPMNVSVSGNTFTIKNFLGEKVPREMKFNQTVSVKISGAEVTVEGNDLELAGQTAAAIEQLTRITNRDRRIFQDGVYITSKT